MDTAAKDNTAFERSAYRKASLRILPLLALGYGGPPDHGRPDVYWRRHHAVFA